MNVPQRNERSADAPGPFCQGPRQPHSDKANGAPALGAIYIYIHTYTFGPANALQRRCKQLRHSGQSSGSQRMQDSQSMQGSGSQMETEQSQPSYGDGRLGTLATLMQMRLALAMLTFVHVCSFVHVR